MPKYKLKVYWNDEACQTIAVLQPNDPAKAFNVHAIIADAVCSPLDSVIVGYDPKVGCNIAVDRVKSMFDLIVRQKVDKVIRRMNNDSHTKVITKPIVHDVKFTTGKYWKHETMIPVRWFDKDTTQWVYPSGQFKFDKPYWSTLK